MGKVVENSYMTPQEVAEHFGVDKRTLRRWEEAGVIKGVRFNSRVLRYRREDVEQLGEVGDNLNKKTAKNAKVGEPGAGE